ncbi:capsid protein [Chryseobacterium mucoviscidosis]|nr:capsid protein [Chryseobacterium mucoviscidosis]
MKKRYDIRQIFSDMEMDLIKSMKRNLKRHELAEEEEGKEWEQWQQRKLQDIQQYRKETRQISKKYEPEVKKAAEEEVKGSWRRGADRVKDTVKSLWNKITGKKPDIEPEDGSDRSFFKLNEKRVNALADAAQNNLQIARHAMLRQADDVYRQTIYKSQVYLNSGAASLNQAIDMATKEFLEKGFDNITYANGRRVNIASYAEMALRTSSQRAVFAGEGAKRDQLGIRTVVISSHGNCSKLCLPYQGKVFIDDVYSGGSAADGKYPLLSTAIAGGLFHPNCRHNMTTFIVGTSSLPNPVDDEKALSNYQAEQKQRYMERQIRKYKRLEAGSVDEENQANYKAKVRQWQAQLRMHLREHDYLRRDSKREKLRIPPN